VELNIKFLLFENERSGMPGESHDFAFRHAYIRAADHGDVHRDRAWQARVTG
jgi:hypothetical protein